VVVRHYFITVLIGFRHFRRVDLEHHFGYRKVFLPAQDFRALAARDGASAGIATCLYRKTTEEIVARLRKRPEVKSVFVDGGRVPPGTFEVRRAALIINYTLKHDRKITSANSNLRSAVNWKTSRTSASGFWTRTACVRSRGRDRHR